MYSKIRNIFFLTFFLIFILLIFKQYFSEQNIILINKSRLSYQILSNNKTINLPILENDTNNVIVYINDLEKFKKERKKRIWENLINNEN
tara:strand:- start:243 stop:512 length:270 start_codon:yes stop_codon:yes gene_type:complete